jgi:FkbM family methyltransferase
MRKIILLAMDFFDYFHKQKIINFLKKKNKSFDVFIDIGAHKGETIELFTKNFFIKKIYSFEASPINYELLKKKEKRFIKINKDTEIVIENMALGANNTTEVFKQFNESSSSTFKKIDKNSKYFKRKFKLLNYFSKDNVYRELDIKVQKLQDYIIHKNLTRIDFLKIDTEGYEYEILLGLGNKISLVKIIMFEHHYDNMIKKDYNFRHINDLLLNKNFKQVYKSKMPFRKTFEYIYIKNGN